MKHLIIGCGTVGRATGIWLIAKKEDVCFWDKKQEVLNRLRSEGYKINPIERGFDFYWVCTHEKYVEDVVREIKSNDENAFVVVRSTTPIGFCEKLSSKFNIRIVHMPEFLREKTALEDMFNPDRIIVGITSVHENDLINMFHYSVAFPSTKPAFLVDATTSEIVKLVSNAWLSTQISFWNEIKKLCDVYGVNPQLVADVCCLDKRISRYGAMMLGKPFGGKCLPKDLDTLIKCFRKKKIDPVLLKSVKKVNEKIKEGNK